MKIIEKDVLGGDMVTPGIPPYTRTGFEDSYDINASGTVILSRTTDDVFRTPLPPICVKRIDFIPTWSGGYFYNQSHYVHTLRLAPYVRGVGLTPNNFCFSSILSTFTLNEYTTATNRDVSNDVRYDKPFVVEENESLRVKLWNCSGSTGVANGYINSVDFKEDHVVRVRVYYQDYDYKHHYGRLDLNNTLVTGTSFSDTDVVLLDLMPSATQSIPSLSALSTSSFQGSGSVSANNAFMLDNLALQGSVPFSQMDTDSRFTYSILVKTVGQENPLEDYYVRKYVRFYGATGASLVAQELLDTPLHLKQGQQLILRIYALDYSMEATFDAIANRQAPSIWFDGEVTSYLNTEGTNNNNNGTVY